MTEQEKVPERSRRDWIIILIILLIGFLCVIVAGQWAIRFSPTWKLDTDMGSNIDPNSIFLTSRPNDFFEPLDPSILTQPVWIDVFLTPGASFLTNEPGTPLPTNTPLTINTPIPTAIVSPTSTAIIPSPTNTIIYFPPPTNTPKPPSTNTPVPPSLSADLSITKTDGVTTYTPGGSLTYTIVVSNTSGPNAVTGATVTDTFPVSLTNITWTCAPTGSAACTANGTGNINDKINLAVGSSVTYTVDVDILGSASGDLTNTATVSVPAGVSDPTPANNSSTDTDIQSTLNADLQILKTDGVTTYTPGNQVIYGIVVFNAGLNAVTGATVTDLLPAQITSASWTCLPLGASSCSTPSGSGNIVNHSINLPVGSSVVYAITANTHANSVGNLVNTASVSVPAGYNDINPADNTSTDTDTPTGSVGSGINIGGPDGSDYNPGPNGSVTILFSPAITADGTSTPDFVYYEVLVDQATPPRVDMDWVMIEISANSTNGTDGTWIPVFIWGGSPPSPPDTNSNVDINVIGGLEDDNRQFNPASLYNQTGVTIDIDSIVPPGSYPWMRISGIGGVDGPNIDAIQPYYP